MAFILTYALSGGSALRECTTALAALQAWRELIEIGAFKVEVYNTSKASLSFEDLVTLCQGPRPISDQTGVEPATWEKVLTSPRQRMD
jgi:hypothetical protein